jgi:cytochrome c556
MGMGLSHKHLLCIAACIGLMSPLHARREDVVSQRIMGYRNLGANFKAANDALRSSSAPTTDIRTAAAAIQRISREQYRWFPAGSGSSANPKSAAKAEIWNDPAAFRAAQDRFAQQADSFVRATQGRDIKLMRGEARRLAGTCKGCHDAFRASRD